MADNKAPAEEKPFVKRNFMWFTQERILYLHGGITNDWEAEVIVARGYADHTGMDKRPCGNMMMLGSKGFCSSL